MNVRTTGQIDIQTLLALFCSRSPTTTPPTKANADELKRLYSKAEDLTEDLGSLKAKSALQSPQTPPAATKFENLTRPIPKSKQTELQGASFNFQPSSKVNFGSRRSRNQTLPNSNTEMSSVEPVAQRHWYIEEQFQATMAKFEALLKKPCCR